jgi:hypothetical protein
LRINAQGLFLVRRHPENSDGSDFTVQSGRKSPRAHAITAHGVRGIASNMLHEQGRDRT